MPQMFPMSFSLLVILLCAVFIFASIRTFWYMLEQPFLSSYYSQEVKVVKTYKQTW